MFSYQHANFLISVRKLQMYPVGSNLSRFQTILPRNAVCYEMLAHLVSVLVSQEFISIIKKNLLKLTNLLVEFANIFQSI